MTAAGFGGGTGSAGGYTLPSAISASLLDSLLEASVILPRARIIPMGDRVVSVWGFDNESQNTAGTLMGGIQFSVVPEQGAGSIQSGRVRAVRLEAKKLMAVTKVSQELLSDSANFEAELRRNFAAAAGFVLDDMLINGAGAGGEFLGVLNCPSKIAVTSTGQTTSTYVYNNAIAQRARLMDGGDPIWIVNQDTLPQLYSMTLANAGLVQAFDGRSLLGIPVVVSSKAQPVGTEGDVILADLSKFIVGLRSEIQIESSAHFAFDSHEVAFRLVLRLDSADSMTKPLTPRYSSSTLGWCVTLATRTT
jgi:HK97 family phage major capsid protein